MSASLSKVKNAIYHSLMKERRASWGSGDPDLQFFVIRRSSHAGIGSYLITHLGCLKYAAERWPQAIPVVDMTRYRQGIAERAYSKWDILSSRPAARTNVWELFFEQPGGYTLDAIAGSRNVILSDGDPAARYPNPWSERCYSYESLARCGYAALFDRYIRLQPALRQQFEAEWARIAGGAGKILGVKARKTGYASERPSGLNVQPEEDLLLQKADEMLQAGGYARLFLATEDVTVEESFRAHYGERLLTVPKAWNCFTAVDNPDGQIDYNDPRRVEALGYEKACSQTEDTISYLQEMYLLSRCDALLAGRSSGIFYVLLENRGRFEDVFLFDLGSYS